MINITLKLKVKNFNKVGNLPMQSKNYSFSNLRKQKDVAILSETDYNNVLERIKLPLSRQEMEAKMQVENDNKESKLAKARVQIHDHNFFLLGEKIKNT